MDAQETPDTNRPISSLGTLLCCVVVTVCGSTNFQLQHSLRTSHNFLPSTVSGSQRRPSVYGHNQGPSVLGTFSTKNFQLQEPSAAETLNIRNPSDRNLQFQEPLAQGTFSIKNILYQEHSVSRTFSIKCFSGRKQKHLQFHHHLRVLTRNPQ